MNTEQAEALLQALGSKASSHSEVWVRGSCPLARWRHQSGKDKKPSFGLFVRQGEPGRFHCFSCESGSLHTLIQLMELHILQSPGEFHGDLQKAREIVENEALEMPVLPGYQEFGQSQQKVFQPLPDYVLEIGPLATQVPRAVEYLKYRGYDPWEVVADWGIRYDYEHDRLVFPYWDVHGRLAGMRGRGVQMPGETHFTPHHDYVWNNVNNSQLTWFNEQALNLPGPVVVVEGQFDCMRAAKVWKKTVANLTAKPVLAKMLKLTHSEGVILLLDGDDTGRLATEKYMQYCAVMNTPVCPVYLPTADENGEKIKTDPDKLGSAWIAEALTNIGLLTNYA